MLGSHNSMSYLKPIHWWQRWQKPWYRCQEINLVQQYKQGVRYFDIRVNLIHGEWHFVHNKIDFGHINGGFKDIDKLIELAEKENQEIYFSVILDRRKAPKTKEEQEYLLIRFRNLISWAIDAYKKYNVICLDSVIVYWNWKKLYVDPIHPEVAEYHNSVIHRDHLLKYLFGNKHFSKKHNHEYVANSNLIKFYNQCILMDFVNIR